MAGPRDKRKAEASRTGDVPDQPKRRRRGGVVAAPPELVLEASRRPAGSVYRADMMGYVVAHKLRSGRKILVLNTSGRGPMEFRKGETPVPDVSWKIPACVKVALEHYNQLNEDVHELVKAVDGYTFLYIGEWMHANFLAKSKEGITKSFFAELKIEGKNKISCVICTEMNPDDPKTAPFRGGCEICPSRIFHPAAGGYEGAKPGAGGDLGASGEVASLFNVDAMASA